MLKIKGEEASPDVRSAGKQVENLISDEGNFSSVRTDSYVGKYGDHYNWEAEFSDVSGRVRGTLPFRRKLARISLSRNEGSSGKIEIHLSKAVTNNSVISRQIIGYCERRGYTVHPNSQFLYCD